MCRLCLKNAESLEEIFENNDDSSLVLRIMACVSLEVHKMDNLPKKICAPCRYQLEKTYIFRSKCRENDSRLRRHVKLLLAGKNSTVLEDLDDDDDEFGPSLQYIGVIDEEKKRQRKMELDVEIIAHHEKLKLELEAERKSIRDEAVQQYIQDRRRNMVDTAVESCNLEPEIISIVPDDGTAQLQEGSTEQPENDCAENPCELADIEYETVEDEQPDENVADSTFDVKPNIQEKMNRKATKQEEQMIEYMDQDVSMEEDVIDDSASAITILHEDKQSKHASEASTVIHPSSSDTAGFVITEMDSECDMMDDELDQEERKLYSITDDSDEDIEAVTNAVKAELAEQPGFNVGENCIMKVEKDRDLTKVEVRAEDGSIICMEFSTEPMKKPTESLTTLRSKVAGMFKCPHCNMLSKSPKLLQDHVYAEHPEYNKGLVCDVCAKWCPSKCMLERHYRTHTGEKPFVCGECGRGFVQKEVLKRHMLLHTNERPFPCQHCPNRYNQKNQLIQHVNKVHTENPAITIHRCNLCSKEFRYSSGLSRHISTHYGRTYDCLECGRVFNDQSARNRHQRDVHGEGKKDNKEATTFSVI